MNNGLRILRAEFLSLLKQLQQLLLLACIAAPGIVLGQVAFESEELAEEQVEAVRIYRVELIVFEHTDKNLFGNEVFVAEQLPQVVPALLPALQPGELPETLQIGPVFPPTFGDPGTILTTNLPVAIDDTLFLGNDSPEYQRWLDEQPLNEVPSHILQTRLKVLDPEEYAMPETYQRLVNLNAYAPILRAAWTQAVYERDQTLPIDLRRLGNPPLRLDGVLTLYLSRFLHLVVDLSIDSDSTAPAGQDERLPIYYGDNRTRNFFDEDYGAGVAPVQYRIVEDRIFRNGELRYYDHPRFGVLAKITRVEEPEDAAETDEIDLLPAN
jgi:hypothetical protein